MVACARTIARRAHENQTDRGGTPYIRHPEAVAALVEGTEARCVAWLHDVVEDTEVTLEALREAGFSEEVVTAVDAISKRRGESWKETDDEYLARVKENALATYVKLADMKHNSDLSRIPNPTEKDRRRCEKYRCQIRALRETALRKTSVDEN